MWILIKYGDGFHTTFCRDCIYFVSFQDCSKRKKIADIIIHHQYALSDQYICFVVYVFDNSPALGMEIFVIDIQMRDCLIQQMINPIKLFENVEIRLEPETIEFSGTEGFGGINNNGHGWFLHLAEFPNNFIS